MSTKKPVSPYLNQFTQPDSIIPDLSHPQYLNRYSYVINNPILYNDPDGHCGGPACVIIVPVTLLALVAIGIIYYSQPSVQAAGQEFMASASNILDDWRFTYPHKETIKRQEANYNKTGDDLIIPGPGYEPPKRGGWAFWTIAISAFSYIAYKGFCAANEEVCAPPTEYAPTETTPTVTPTMTPTSTCPPPYTSCAATSTTTPNTPSVPTSTPTLPSTPTLTPPSLPNIIPFPSNRLPAIPV